MWYGNATFASMKSTIAAFIFDLDGVIVDTARYHYRSWQRLCRSFGFEFTEADNEQLKGASRMHSLEIILELAGETRSEDEKIDMCAKKNSWYLESIQEITNRDTLPGVQSFIKLARQENYLIALGSASKNAVAIIRQLELTSSFDVMIDGNMVAHGKPDPEGFLLAARKLCVRPDQCLVLEDAAKGIQAAQEAGMHTVGIGDSLSLGAADLVIDTLLNQTPESILECI